MKEVDRLVEILDTLLGPAGCPWDRKQTLKSMRTALLEEAHEVIDAIERGDNEHLAEELGDLCFNAFFLCKMGEKEGRCTTEQVFNGIADKLIRRHPWVFGDDKADDPEEAARQWEAIKKVEKANKPQNKVSNDIPLSMPALSRAARLAKVLDRVEYPSQQDVETGIGAELFELCKKARANKVDPELALNSFVNQTIAAADEWQKLES